MTTLHTVSYSISLNRIKFVRSKVKSQKLDIKKIPLHLLLFDQFISVLPNFINVYISMARTVNIYIVSTQTFSIYYNGAMKANHITNWFVSSTPNGNYYIFNTNEAIIFFFLNIVSIYFHGCFDFNLNIYILYFKYKSLNKLTA